MGNETTPPTRARHLGVDGQAATHGEAFALAAVTGFVDGLGASYISGVFVSYMSGNTTGAGIALAALDLGELWRILPAIGLYVIAVTVGAAVFLRWPRARPALYLVAIALLVGFLAAALAMPVPPANRGSGGEVILLALLVVPMGLLTMTMRRVDGATVGLGYVTGALVSLGERLASLIVTRRSSEWRRVGLFAGLWLCFFGGAVAGAAGNTMWGAWSVAVPVGVLAVLLVKDVRAQSSAGAVGDERHDAV